MMLYMVVSKGVVFVEAAVGARVVSEHQAGLWSPPFDLIGGHGYTVLGDVYRPIRERGWCDGVMA